MINGLGLFIFGFWGVVFVILSDVDLLFTIFFVRFCCYRFYKGIGRMIDCFLVMVLVE